MPLQGLHRLEKYLNLEGFLGKSLKTKSALKRTGKSLKSLEKSLNSNVSVGLGTVDIDLNHCENCLEEVEGATACSFIMPPLLQDPSSYVQLMCPECDASCKQNLVLDQSRSPALTVQ